MILNTQVKIIIAIAQDQFICTYTSNSELALKKDITIILGKQHAFQNDICSITMYLKNNI